jgi:hypothetical protein
MPTGAVCRRNAVTEMRKSGVSGRDLATCIMTPPLCANLNTISSPIGPAGT